MKPMNRKHKKYLKPKIQFFETENTRCRNRIYHILKPKTHGPTYCDSLLTKFDEQEIYLQDLITILKQSLYKLQS